MWIYTSFCKKYLKESDCAIFSVEKAEFNYKTESFITKEYYLPFIINEKGEDEFILLTPSDILRKNEPSLNRDHFLKNNRKVRDYIDNDVLKEQVNNYIAKAVATYEKDQQKNKKKTREGSIKKIEREAFAEIVKEHPEIYDYYIKMREEEKEEINKECNEEVDIQIDKFINNAQELINIFQRTNYVLSESNSAYEESKNRTKYFKHIIEDCDGYKNLYYKGERISTENDL